MPKAAMTELSDTSSHENMLETLFADLNWLSSHSSHRSHMTLGHSRNVHPDSSKETRLELRLRFAHQLCRKLRKILLCQKC